MVNTFIHSFIFHSLVTEHSADMELFFMSLGHIHLPFYKYPFNIAFKIV